MGIGNPLPYTFYNTFERRRGYKIINEAKHVRGSDFSVF